MRIEPRSLVRRLTPTATRWLEAAVGRGASSQHSEITVEHMVLAMLEAEDCEVIPLLQHANVDRKALRASMARAVERLRGGSAGRPTLSQNLFRWFQDAWLIASLERGEIKLRSSVLLLQLAAEPERYLGDDIAALSGFEPGTLLRELDQIVGDSLESTESAAQFGGSAPTTRSEAAGTPAKDGPLARFAVNFTESARAGKIDPIFGRHREIRQLIDILSRRRKNNPIIVGEPGVGKTALVEGLARAIVLGDVPSELANVDLYGLDLGLLQAGASVKGEFENRLKGVIAEVKSSVKPIILFIDEAHTLIGSGGNQGNDAANLLKPALARGELRTVAATTWAEYKKYFEKDAALERRFQPVKVDEPSEEDAIVMMRGLREVYETAHGVTIRDEAVKSAVQLSSRYISGRQLPDKAVDLLDTAAARIRVERATKPERLVELEMRVASLARTEEALARDITAGDETLSDDLMRVKEEQESNRSQLDALQGRWEGERSALNELLAARNALAEAESAEPAAAKTTLDQLRAKTVELARKLEQLGGDDRLIHADVDTDAVARTVASWTGIPVGKMTRDAASSVLRIEQDLISRIIGQDFAISTVAETLRIAHAGIRNPDSPIGVLLFVGPSGVGKTETALGLADLLYGGERFMTTINMSEFQEKHTVSRLIGSPPGYVGYGEGGLLTEAVRQRPYSVVLLDECEKADLDVMNLFYQVFDKGVLSDGEGRPINFRNTLLVLTSNLATDQIMECFANGATPSMADVVDQIRPTLSKHFKPALLARMTIVPYAPISSEALKQIAVLKTDKVAKRVAASHGLSLLLEDGVLENIVARCHEAETGARNVDHILRGSLMPAIASTLLERMADEDAPTAKALRVGLDAQGQWRIEID